jgi:GLPGLI family protein
MRTESLLFILVFILVSTLHAQNSGTVTYKLLMPENEEAKKQNTTIQGFYKKTHERGEQLTFKLDFNTVQSHFYINEVMHSDINNDDKTTKIVAIMLGKVDFYYDNKKNIGIYYSPLDGILMREEYAKKEWVLTTENKKIDNYLCYRAEHDMVYERNGKELTTKIIAWYAPLLPYSYGPLGYNNDLPGLILELTEFDRTIYVTKIELKEKPIAIKFPTGKSITEEEYLGKNSSSLYKK